MEYLVGGKYRVDTSGQAFALSNEIAQTSGTIVSVEKIDPQESDWEKFIELYNRFKYTNKFVGTIYTAEDIGNILETVIDEYRLDDDDLSKYMDDMIQESMEVLVSWEDSSGYLTTDDFWGACEMVVSEYIAKEESKKYV